MTNAATSSNSPGLNRNYPTIEELKHKYESYIMAADPTLAKSQLSAHKMYKKSKVQQIASMFDNKISQSADDAKNASKNLLTNSPEAKQQINTPIPAIRYSIRSNSSPRKNSLVSNPPEVKSDIINLPTPVIRHSVRSNFAQKQASSPRKNPNLNEQQTTNTFLVSEDAFTKLSVKHKVQLYNQFVSEMYKKNPKFVRPDEQIEAAVEKAAAVTGEVVNEKQASVKQLLAKLEACCSLPGQKMCPLALQRISSNKNDTENAKLYPTIAKEFEDILENEGVSHTSTLNVKLKPRKTVTCRERSKSLPRYKNENKDEFNVALEDATSQKRHNGEMRCCILFEACGPPKKIRCTRAERPIPKALYQTQEMKKLFFTWLSEREQKENDKEDGETKNTSNSNKDLLSENTATKCENSDNSTGQSSSENPPTKCKTLEPTPRPRKKKPAPPIPAAAISSQISTKTPDKLQSKEDNETGFPLLQKITSDDSRADKPAVSSEKEFEFVKLFKPVRKKKLRRNLSWENSESSEETIPTTNSTDSDTEIKTDDIKNTTNQINEKRFDAHPSSEELNNDLLREANSPGKIKSVYTLTAYSPSPTQEEDDKIKDSKSQTSQSWDSTSENFSSSSHENKEKIDYLRQKATEAWSAALKDSQQQQFTSTKKVSCNDVTGSASTTFDSFIDQGFETGSNGMGSPVRSPKNSDSQFLKSTTEARKGNANCYHLSAPHTGNQSPQFNNSLSQQQLYSSSPTPLKSRRQSVCDNELRRSSLAMQVIRENEPLQHNKIPKRSSNIKEQNLATNNPSVDTPAIVTGLRTEKGSQFWIKCNHFSLAFDIFYSEAGHLRMLYNIFCEKSCDNMGLYFGIDDLIFCISPANEKQNFTKCLQQQYSTYWFAAGDAFIPFAGKRVSGDKIKHIFEFLKTSLEDNGVLHFGVDDIEFSSVREFWSQIPKFSMDSNYSMLVGLQSGSSNGLEGRSKNAWPRSQSARLSYLDQTNSGAENLEDTHSGRSSVSPFSDSHFHFTTSSPTEAQYPKHSLRNSQMFNFGSRSDSLDHLFDEENKEMPQPLNLTAPASLKKIKAQQQCLRLIQEKLSKSNNLAKFSCSALDVLKATPQYINHLRRIVTKIVNKGRRDGFNSCTFQQLQSYMIFLSRYADICLHDCSGHFDKVLDSLLDHRSLTV